MFLYSPVFLKVFFILAVLGMAASTVFAERRLKRAKSGGHLKLRCRTKYTRAIVLSVAWIIITSGNLLVRLGYERYEEEGQVLFYKVMLALFIMALVWNVFNKLRYGWIFLAPDGILRDGYYYDGKKITYGSNNSGIVFYDEKGKEMFRITADDSGDLNEAKDFIRNHYRPKEVLSENNAEKEPVQ